MKYLELDRKIQGREYFLKLLKYSNESSHFHIASFVNPFSYIELLKSPSLIDEVDSFFTDGALLRLFHNRFYSTKKVERLSFDFSSIADDVFEWCQYNNKKVALVGAEPSEIIEAVQNIVKLYPDLNIVYSHDGYVKKNDVCEGVQKNIIDSGAEILICGMGTPLQEAFLIDFKNRESSLQLGFTCGGFLTQTSIKPDYYHPLIKKTGLRWLQRVIMHSHVRNRVFKDYPKFVLFYLQKHFQ
jgi:exopolysaccharide biosynthesis WecB/TagA/CpsF family protein